MKRRGERDWTILSMRRSWNGPGQHGIRYQGAYLRLGVDAETNDIVLEKAIRYQPRGVVGIDLAGTETNAIELNESVVRYAEIFQRARDAGLGTTIHTGETKNTSGEGVTAVVRRLKPDRIGHGIRAAYSEEAIGALVESQTVLGVPRPICILAVSLMTK